MGNSNSTIYSAEEADRILFGPSAVNNDSSSKIDLPILAEHDKLFKETNLKMSHLEGIPIDEMNMKLTTANGRPDDRLLLLRKYIHRDIFTTYTSNRKVPANLTFAESYLVRRDAINSKPRASAPSAPPAPKVKYQQGRVVYIESIPIMKSKSTPNILVIESSDDDRESLMESYPDHLTSLNIPVRAPQDFSPPQLANTFHNNTSASDFDRSSSLSDEAGSYSPPSSVSSWASPLDQVEHRGYYKGMKYTPYNMDQIINKPEPPSSQTNSRQMPISASDQQIDGKNRIDSKPSKPVEPVMKTKSNAKSSKSPSSEPESSEELRVAPPIIPTQAKSKSGTVTTETKPDQLKVAKTRSVSSKIPEAPKTKINVKKPRSKSVGSSSRPQLIRILSLGLIGGSSSGSKDVPPVPSLNTDPITSPTPSKDFDFSEIPSITASGPQAKWTLSDTLLKEGPYPYQKMPERQVENEYRKYTGRAVRQRRSSLAEKESNSHINTGTPPRVPRHAPKNSGSSNESNQYLQLTQSSDFPGSERSVIKSSEHCINDETDHSIHTSLSNSSNGDSTAIYTRKCLHLQKRRSVFAEEKKKGEPLSSKKTVNRDLGKQSRPEEVLNKQFMLSGYEETSRLKVINASSREMLLDEEDKSPKYRSWPAYDSKVLVPSAGHRRASSPDIWADRGQSFMARMV